MAAAVTLLPALLGFVGRNIDRLGLPHRRKAERTGHHSIWYRWSRVLQRHPWPGVIVGGLVLLVLAVPALSMRLGFGDAGQPSDLRHHPPGLRPALARLRARVQRAAAARDARRRVVPTTRPSSSSCAPTCRQATGRCAVSPPQSNEAGDVSIMQVFPTTSPQDDATGDLVERLRDDIVPGAVDGTEVRVDVGGLTAAVDDFSDYTASRLPVFIGAVLLLSFLLLMLVFRSLLVPLKAVVMNLLSIGAAYGVVVAVFQWGWGEDLFGVGKSGPIEAWAPMFLFAVVFGLSMDYEVFLLSRIHEEYDRTGDNATAVADGLAVTARVITAAAAIMVCVFGSFVFGPERSLQLFGLGLAVAVLRRRHDRPARARPRDDGAARRPQLVVPALARPHPAPGARRGPDARTAEPALRRRRARSHDGRLTGRQLSGWRPTEALAQPGLLDLAHRVARQRVDDVHPLGDLEARQLCRARWPGPSPRRRRGPARPRSPRRLPLRSRRRAHR